MDIEKLETLPKFESRKASLVRRYKNMYNVDRFDRYKPSLKTDNFWWMARVIVETHVGKPVDVAFSKWCHIKKASWNDDYFWWNFWSHKYRGAEYSIVDGIIVKNIPTWKKAQQATSKFAGLSVKECKRLKKELTQNLYYKKNYC